MKQIHKLYIHGKFVEMVDLIDAYGPRFWHDYVAFLGVYYTTDKGRFETLADMTISYSEFSMR